MGPCYYGLLCSLYNKSITWCHMMIILTVVGSLGGKAGGWLSVVVLVLTDGTGLGGTDGGDVARSYI